jgi:hypothetical protein
MVRATRHAILANIIAAVARRSKGTPNARSRANDFAHPLPRLVAVMSGGIMWLLPVLVCGAMMGACGWMMWRMLHRTPRQDG